MDTELSGVSAQLWHHAAVTSAARSSDVQEFMSRGLDIVEALHRRAVEAAAAHTWPGTGGDQTGLCHYGMKEDARAACLRPSRRVTTALIGYSNPAHGSR
eukprot:scaffold7_cov378-Prasinococcus_capsulatus_cf.AAC.8